MEEIDRVILNRVEQSISVTSTNNFLAAFTQQNRLTHWELVKTIPLAFPTHHPQGLAFAGDYIFISSVQVLESPSNVFDPVRSTPGRGAGHMFVLNHDGKLVQQIRL